MSNWLPEREGLQAPLYISLANRIAGAIEAGDLAAGDRLPTHRDLAFHLGVSVHTVSQAYAEAERRGLVVGETGRGTYVQQGPNESEPHFIMDRRRENLVDLSINRPATDRIHSARTRAALATLSRSGDESYMLACRPIAGLDPHRAAAARWLAWRGLQVDPGQVLICNGAAHGMTVALSALTRPGDLVVAENLVDHGLIGLAGVLGFRLEGLELDREGILPESFEAACRQQDVKVLCTTPCLNNPTVALMGEERRRRIAEIARRHGVAIVEDDVYGLLLPDAPPPLRSFHPEGTCYITSFTKSVVSGLRCGYLVAPPHLSARLVSRIRATSWMATPLAAEIARLWIEDGTARELVEWQRRELNSRHAMAVESLRGLEYESHPNALHLWLELPARWRAESFVSEARVRGVALTPAEPFALGSTALPNRVRLSLAAAQSQEQLRRGLETLVALSGQEPEPYVPT